MDKISELPDELQITPCTPRLHQQESALTLHRAQVIERLCLELWKSSDSKVNPEDIKLWILDSHGCSFYEIDTPCLEYLRLEDWNLHRTVCSEVEEDVYYGGLVFDQLEHLELCVCKDDSLNLLALFLKDSPNLLDCHGDIVKTDDRFAWYHPSCVPECMLPSLRVFNWSRYVGRPRDRDISVYILRNAPNLRTATFRFDTDVPNLNILEMELTLYPPASSTCELVFVESIEFF
ncbi:hypothetical protein Bca4012_064686 [Brassica carinata]